jgi:hypothetical protein
MAGKYNKSVVMIGGKEVDRMKVCFIPKEENGKFTTRDGTTYQRDKNGTIRRVNSK